MLQTCLRNAAYGWYLRNEVQNISSATQRANEDSKTYKLKQNQNKDSPMVHNNFNREKQTQQAISAI
jgi:hypothetical protein